MADIFISYANEDRDRVIPIVKALEEQGWSIFWDWKSIPVGKTWRGVIDEGLEAARCILVLWSTISTTKGRRWVLEEADFGLERDILIPALLDEVRPPRGFGQIQSAKLINWTGDINNVEFKKLVGALESILGPSPKHVRESKQITEAERTREQEEERRKTQERLRLEEEQKQAEFKRKAEMENNRKEIEAKPKSAEVPEHKEMEEEAKRVISEVQQRGQPEKLSPKGPEAPEAAILASTVEKKIVWPILLTAMLCGVFTLYNQFLDFFYLQIFTAFYIGYRYTLRVAVVSGILIFLPNLILHLIGMHLIPIGFNDTGGNTFDTFKGTLFQGTRYLGEEWRTRTLGIAFLYYASLSPATAIIRQKFHTLLGKATFLSNQKKQLTKTSMMFIIPQVLLLPTAINIGAWGFSGIYILYSSFFLWVYLYGIQQMKWPFIILLLIHTIQRLRIDALILFNVFGHDIVPLFFIFLIVCNYFALNDHRVTLTPVYSIPLILFFLLTGISVHISSGINVSFSDLAIPCFFWIGYKHGSNAAFKAAVIWGCAMSFIFKASASIMWGSADIQYIIAAALLGYLGGIESVRTHFMEAGIKIIFFFYCIILIVRLTTKGFTLYDVELIIEFGVNVFLLIFLSFFTRQQQQTTL